MKQHINFHPRKIGTTLIRVKEVFLQKNGAVGHVLEVKPNNKPASEMFIWKDKKKFAHIDGDLRGLNHDQVLLFLYQNEYKLQ